MKMITRSNFLLRWSLMLAAFALALGGLMGPARAAAIAIDLAPANPTTVTVPFENRLGGAITFNITSAPPAAIELYPQGTAAEDRARRACRLTVSGNAAVLDATAAGNLNCSVILASSDALPKMNISPAGANTFTTLEFEHPFLDGGPSIQAGGTLHLPADSNPSSCYVNIVGWKSVSCTGGTINPPAALGAQVAAKGDKLYLVAKIDGAHGTGWYKVSLLPPAAISGLEQRCQTQLGTDQGNIDSGSLYVVCADVTNPFAPVSILLYRAEGASSFTKAPYPSRIFVRTPVLVYAWHGPDQCPVISRRGTDGIASSLFVSPGIKAEAGKPALACGVATAPVRYDIPPQKADLTIDIKVKVDSTQEITVTRTLTIENQYRMALRVGLGLAWSPWAREIGIRSTASNTKYAAVTDGNGPVPGLFAPELVVSYSYFVGRPMSDVNSEWRFGLNAGLGVLRVGQGSVTALSSLRLGIELAYGLDFSLGLSAGIHHHDFPKDGFQPGTALPNGTTTIDTRYGLTPGFGLVLNLTPSVLKTAGILAGG